MKLCGIVLGLVATVTYGVTAGGAAEGPAQVSAAGSNRISDDYRIGAGDLLDIQVVGHAELAQSLRVSNSGEISFPLLGFIRVADLTAFEIEDRIVQGMREKKLLEDPQVLVMVMEYHAAPIYVSGAVVNPGEYMMSQELTAVDAILLAGGLRFNAADEALLHRRPRGGEGRGEAASSTETVRIDLRPFKNGRFLEETITLSRGDNLVVPEMVMHPFYVVGEVLDPRNFFYQPGRTLTASQAISWSGGPTLTAKLSNGMLVRYDDQGQRIEKKVDFKAILEGRELDFSIEPEDIIFIPGSKIKNLGQGLLELTDTMIMQASFRVARTYQLPGPGEGLAAREAGRDDR